LVCSISYMPTIIMGTIITIDHIAGGQMIVQVTNNAKMMVAEIINDLRILTEI